MARKSLNEVREEAEQEAIRNQNAMLKCVLWEIFDYQLVQYEYHRMRKDDFDLFAANLASGHMIALEAVALRMGLTDFGRELRELYDKAFVKYSAEPPDGREMIEGLY